MRNLGYPVASFQSSDCPGIRQLGSTGHLCTRYSRVYRASFLVIVSLRVVTGSNKYNVFLIAIAPVPWRKFQHIGLSRSGTHACLGGCSTTSQVLSGPKLSLS